MCKSVLSRGHLSNATKEDCDNFGELSHQASSTVMANTGFKRVLNEAVGNSSDNCGRDSSHNPRYPRAGAAAAAAANGGTVIGDDDLDSKDRIQLSGEISAVRMHQISIMLRPLARSSSSGGKTVRLTASRWEIRKAIMSLCCVPPTTMEVGHHRREQPVSIVLNTMLRAALSSLWERKNKEVGMSSDRASTVVPVETTIAVSSYSVSSI